MTSVEGWLLEHMTVRRWLLTAVCLIASAGWIGWELGERHLANQFVDQMQTTADQMKLAIVRSGLAK